MGDGGQAGAGHGEQLRTAGRGNKAGRLWHAGTEDCAQERQAKRARCAEDWSIAGHGRSWSRGELGRAWELEQGAGAQKAGCQAPWRAGSRGWCELVGRKTREKDPSWSLELGSVRPWQGRSKRASAGAPSRQEAGVQGCGELAMVSRARGCAGAGRNRGRAGRGEAPRAEGARCWELGREVRRAGAGRRNGWVHGEEEEEEGAANCASEQRGRDKAERQGRTAAESSPAVSGGQKKYHAVRYGGWIFL